MSKNVWRDLFLLTVCAALMFGGTFTCLYDSDDDDDAPFPRPFPEPTNADP